jgi:hypothetical protein
MGNLPDLAIQNAWLPAFWRFSCGTTSQISQDAVNVYDEALAQLLAQKEADSFRIQVQVVSQVTIIWHPQF